MTDRSAPVERPSDERDREEGAMPEPDFLEEMWRGWPEGPERESGT